MKNIEEKFEKYKLETEKVLIDCEANTNRAIAVIAQTRRDFDFAFFHELKAAAKFAKNGNFEIANISLCLAFENLNKTKDFVN